MREANADEREASEWRVSPVWSDVGEPDYALDERRCQDADPEERFRALWDFVRLAENTAERLPDFVRRWGLLEWVEGSSRFVVRHEKCIADWTEAAED